ncbi:MAG: hypothetical protein IPG61_12225 [bacterium]|nr:hypothetical protein [bacterium]
MRAEFQRVEPAAPAPAALSERCLDPTRWDAAWRRFLDEDYAAALELARGCLDCLADDGTG